jgi:hypothetical protein
LSLRALFDIINTVPNVCSLSDCLDNQLDENIVVDKTYYGNGISELLSGSFTLREKEKEVEKDLEA